MYGLIRHTNIAARETMQVSKNVTNITHTPYALPKDVVWRTWDKSLEKNEIGKGRGHSRCYRLMRSRWFQSSAANSRSE
jgi:hypothetical protein